MVASADFDEVRFSWEAPRRAAVIRTDSASSFRAASKRLQLKEGCNTMQSAWVGGSLVKTLSTSSSGQSSENSSDSRFDPQPPSDPPSAAIMRRQDPPHAAEPEQGDAPHAVTPPWLPADGKVVPSSATRFTACCQGARLHHSVAPSTAQQTKDVQDEAMRRWKAAVAADGADLDYGTVVPLENGWAGEAIAIVTTFLMLGWVYIGPVLLCWLLYRIIAHGSPTAAVSLVALLSLQVLPAQLFWEPWRTSPLWDTWRRYFRMRWVTPRLPYLEPGQRALFLHFPHGIYPMGSWLSMGLTGGRGVLGIREPCAGSVASIALHVPLLRHWYSWMGCIGAEAAGIRRMLKRRCLGCTPEGVAGIFLGSTREVERIYFSRRKGLIRLAIQEGVALVPAYTLGQSQVFTYWGLPGLSRKLRTACGLIWGRAYTPVPHKTDLILLLGEPIPVKQADDPSLEQVDEVHAQAAAAVRALFYRHRHLLPGWEHRELRIV